MATSRSCTSLPSRARQAPSEVVWALFHGDGMDMEVGVAVAAFVVQPGRCDHAGDRLLTGALGAGPGAEHLVLLGPAEHFGHGAFEHFSNSRPGPLVTHRPHERKALGHAEGEVVTSDWRLLAGGRRTSEGLAGERVGEQDEHLVEHLGGDHVAGLERAWHRPEAGQALAEELARRRPPGRVVARRPGTLAGPAAHVVDQVLPSRTANLQGLAHREHCSASTSAFSSARLSGLLLVGAEVAIFQWWPAWCRPALLTGHHQVQEVHKKPLGDNEEGQGRHVLPLLGLLVRFPRRSGLRLSCHKCWSAL